MIIQEDDVGNVREIAAYSLVLLGWPYKVSTSQVNKCDKT